MKTEIYATTLSTVECSECGVVFAMTDAFIAQRRKDHKTFYCPNGHTRYWPAENKEELLKRQLASARGNEAWLRERVDAEKRKKAAAKGQLTKLKNRIANGVCPCCNRHFSNLDKHMHTRHPEFAEASS